VAPDFRLGPSKLPEFRNLEQIGGQYLVDIQGYIGEIRALYASGQTTEHSFRPALAKLFGAIDPALTVINEPKQLTDVGAPDFVFNRGDVAIGWCEAKDIGKDVRKFAANDYSKAQKERYKKGLPNLIYTNGLDFESASSVLSLATIRVENDNSACRPPSRDCARHEGMFRVQHEVPDHRFLAAFWSPVAPAICSSRSALG